MQFSNNMILCVIDNRKTARYGEIRRAVYGITNTMLAQSLKELEQDGLVDRKQYDEMPVRVEYRLNDKAKSLIPILLQLKNGERYTFNTRHTQQKPHPSPNIFSNAWLHKHMMCLTLCTAARLPFTAYKDS
ncbi:transcriptional regulator, HxlR family [Lachnospiraceae bacterium C10]|jgi:DNA-binding HxlR family transcriptional regulator|nr:transcriptional regulator, HxlR family [Lachnospiraceae bacterium C10]